MSEAGGRQERIGVLGGTFDPPHIGHLLLGETARVALGLSCVLFLPAGQPPHKVDDTISAEAHRLAMVELAISDNDCFTADTVDMKRPPPHYTSTLFPLLRDKFSQAELWLLIGGDSLNDLATWHDPQRIVADWRLGVLSRPGSTLDLVALEKQVPGVEQATVVLDGPSVGVSSTDIRCWTAQGRSLRYVVPHSVREYIRTHGLYDAGHQNYSALSSEPVS
ncbi:MAG TPA: nicotinate-nucleotide adenylyltransferase [Candidatus Sulfomarinibacteraceae bacterium]|nr:nicotinate-nucleotide adenylyltransferase [Candidatus Sulfomarinibacteraceae bacterium]